MPDRYSTETSLKNFGKFFENTQNAFLLRKLLFNNIGAYQGNEEMSRRLGGEDFPQSPYIAGQFRPWQAILESNPALTPKEAQNLESIFTFPEKLDNPKFSGESENTYLMAHELAHMLQNSINISMQPYSYGRPGSVFSSGNAGIFQSPRTWHGDEFLPSGRESWLSHYRPEERNAERFASQRGIQAVLLEQLLGGL